MRKTLLFTSFLSLLFYFGLHAQTQTQTFESPGTTNFTVPDGVYLINVQTWGGGGGGGQFGSGGGGAMGAGGGGGGGYAGGVITVAPGDMLTIVVGAGGNGSGANDTPGSNGLASSATHSSGSVAAGGGAGGGGDINGGAGSTGATFTGTVDNQLGFAGGNGGDGDQNEGGGGGGGAGSTENGNNGANLNGGIAATDNGGAGGNGGDDGAGSDGLAYGGGGGGTGDEGGGGGSGASGAVILTYTSFAAAESIVSDAFTTGISPFTVPADVTTILGQAWGGGGGGAQQDGNGGGPLTLGGGGGGGGGYVQGELTVAPGDMIAVGVGNGGAGALDVDNTNGSDGELTGIAHPSGAMSAAGGSGGSATGAGGAGGSGTFLGAVNDQVVFDGGTGGPGDGNEGGGGGSGAGDAQNGNDGINLFGGITANNNGGAGGGGGDDGAGVDGAVNGGGGGGAGDDGGGGGDGASGRAILTYNCGTITLVSGSPFQSITSTSITTTVYDLGTNISGATAAGLPPGVTGTFSAGQFTISGTPTATGIYNYTISTTTISGCTGPTIMGRINVQTIVPINLLSFDGKLTGKTILLHWKTANEINNEKFVIEHSTDGYSFFSIDEVSGAGTSTETLNYQYIDHKPTPGQNFYRLKQMDFDGQYEYSNIVSVFFKQQALVNLFPNPLDHFLKVETTEDGPATIQVFAMNGALLLQQKYAQASLMEIDLSSLGKGLYLVSVQVAGQSYQQRVVKL